MEHKEDPFQFKCISVQTHKQKLRFIGSSARIPYASSLRSKANHCNVEAHSTVGNEGVHDECEYDSDNDRSLIRQLKIAFILGAYCDFILLNP